MKQKKEIRIFFAVGAALMLYASLATVPSRAASSPVRQGQASPAITAQDKQAVAAFEERAKAYTKRREALEEKLPKLSKESTPEQIEAHKAAFQEIVRADRAGAKHGDVFSPDIASYIRATIKNEFKGKERVELRETVLEAETKGIPLRVNYPYPESKELVEMPPTLLLKLPQLPKQLRYRFVGRNMLLVDRENGLIVDYMLNALP
jgi:ABC-type transporter MlaC component